MFIRSFLYHEPPEDYPMYPNLSEVVAMAVGAVALIYAVVPFVVFVLFR